MRKGRVGRRKKPGRPPGANSETTRARVLSAARLCFARAGYAATTNKQIAVEAGLTAAAIYQYFDSKAKLYLATLRDANEALIEEYRRALSGVHGVRQGLRTVLLASAELHRRDPSLSAFLSTLPVDMQRHEEVGRALGAEPSDFVRIIDEIVAAGVRDGEVPEAMHERLVATFVACAMGISLYGAAIDGKALPAVAATLGALIDGTLLPVPVPARRRQARSSRAPQKRTDGQADQTDRD
jgi:AcrR family transcriptional regulator